MQSSDLPLVTSRDGVRATMAAIDKSAKGVALVVDEERRLIATVTDGDIRRAILAGIDLELPVQMLLEQRGSKAEPIVAQCGTPDTDLLHLMTEHSVRQIPLLDVEGRVVDLALLSDLVKEYDLPLTAVVMAGGYGKRLRPLTERLPKPMLPVGDRPLLELVIQQLRRAGIRRINLATHYKSQVIAQHFGDGSDFGVKLRYVEEDQPLGTAGALGLVGESDDPLLVINGDILTSVNFSAMLDFHREYDASMTVAVRQHEFRVPYGVVGTDGVAITGISEKPVVRHLINAGIYLLASPVCRLIPDGRPYDMPELIGRLLAEGHRIVGFPVREYWLDIGQVDDYQKALADVAKGAL